MPVIAETIVARDLRDTRGAGVYLAKRLRAEHPESTRESFTVDTVHMLVKSGRLPAYVFSEDGILIERDEKTVKRAGQGLFFTTQDLDTCPLPNDTAGKPRKAR